MFRARQFSPHRRAYKFRSKGKALLSSYWARLASKETMLYDAVLLPGGAKENSRIGIMCSVKPPLILRKQILPESY